MAHHTSRRSYLKATGCAAAVGVAGCIGSGGDSDEVKIGYVVPLSGPWAYFGEAGVPGVEFAIDWVNENGGIEALDGAELTLETVDAGQEADTATSATQSMADDDNVVAGIGSILSSLTLATTSVAERAQVPWFTLSHSDEIVERGYNYTFKVTPSSSQLTRSQLEWIDQIAQEQGDSQLERTLIVADNTAAGNGFRDALHEYLPEYDIEIVNDIEWTPTLDDASPVVNQMDDPELDAAWIYPTALPDITLIRQTMQEQNVNLPLISQGSYINIIDTLETIGAGPLRNIITQSGSNMMAGQEDFLEGYVSDTDAPYLIEIDATHIASVGLIAQALENTGSTDRDELQSELSSISVSEGLGADFLPVETVEFEDNGLIRDSPGTLSQWQDVQDDDPFETEIAPYSVAPFDFAQRDVNWIA